MVIIPSFTFCYKRAKLHHTPLTVEKWLIHLIGVGAIMEKALKYVGEKEET